MAKQTAFAEIINYILSVTHRMTITYQERMSEVKENKITLDDFKQALIKQKTIDEVRTRKVILISMGMASVANALIIGGTEAIAVYTENPKLAEEALKKIDIGGYISTLLHLVADIRFITKIKKEFCAQLIEEDFQKKLRDLGVK